VTKTELLTVPQAFGKGIDAGRTRGVRERGCGDADPVSQSHLHRRLLVEPQEHPGREGIPGAHRTGDAGLRQFDGALRQFLAVRSRGDGARRKMDYHPFAHAPL
jgi:hypothetical protein